MNIVIPMAGRGTRFARKGFRQPKALIPVLGEPMFVWALKSLPLHLAHRLIFLCLQEHLETTEVPDEIFERYQLHNPIILPVPEVTEGQACTVLLATDLINNNQPLLIHNVDTFCSSNLEQMIQTLPELEDGIITVFKSHDPKWSFAKVNEQGHVIAVAEKNPISSWATAGTYFFRRGRDFVQASRAMIAENERVNGEFYVGPAYNRLIARGAKIILDVADEAWGLGTPEDLDLFLTKSPYAQLVSRH